MKQNERELLLNILHVQSHSYETKRMEAFIIKHIEHLGLECIYDNGNIYVTKGVSDSYPCIVSHTDTVHRIIPDDHFTIIANDEFAIGYDRAKMSASGCGGDDKVGIFICLQMLQEFDAIKVAFFADEEVGCVGSYEANVEWFNDTRFVLQCDRRGNADFVNNIYGTPLQSKRFKKAVAPILKEHGYKATSGMLTDVYALKSLGVNVSVANMSCGYYNPHMDDETIVFADVDNCLQMCRTIFIEMTEVYTHSTPVKSHSNYYGGYNNKYTPPPSTNYSGRDAWANDWDDWDRPVDKAVEQDKYSKEIEFYSTHEQCQSCLEWGNYDEMQYSYDYDCFLCHSCAPELESDNYQQTKK